MAKASLGKLSDFPAGSIKQVKVEGHDDVAVANVNGEIYAIGGKCNHRGGHLGKGKMDGKIVTCPLHGARWDVTTGKLAEFAVKLPDEPTYKVAVEGEEVFIEI